MRARRTLVLLLLLVAGSVSGAVSNAAAQERATPLEPFIARVAQLWAEGRADALVELAPADGRMVLDLGGQGAGPVAGRNAAAALRDLFSGRHTVSTRAIRVTLSGGQPLSGFGEVAWVSRSRGTTVPRNSTVYVGVAWEDGEWRIRELRILG
jgi:hypothetical protein